MRPPVPRLQLITDTALQQRYSHLELVAFAQQAGAPAVQFRQKQWQATHTEQLRATAALLRGSSTQLIVNDHVADAAAVGAGAHVGQGDLPPAEARALLGPSALLGATVHNAAELEALIAAQADIDYIGVGPVFGTQSKRWASGQLPPLGVAGLALLCNLSPWPVIAIGSIARQHLSEVLQAGAFGVAVLSAFVRADNPEREARELVESIDAALH